MICIVFLLFFLIRYTGVYRKRFTFYADLRDMNYGAAESIVKSLTTVYNVSFNLKSA